VTLAFLMTCLPIKAQQASPITPLSADEVVARVTEMNQYRAKGLQTYSSVMAFAGFEVGSSQHAYNTMQHPRC